MTDNNVWQPPAGSPPPTPATPAYGEFAPVQPFGGVPVQGAPQQSGWTPPPKPGLIPLRPLTLGDILSASFKVMRRNPRPTFGSSLLINAMIAILSIAATGLAVALFAGSAASAPTDPENLDALLDSSIQTILLSSISSVAGGIFAILGGAILQGIISLEVSRGTLGEKLPLSGLWSLAKGRIGALLGFSFLSAGVLFAGLGLVAGLVALLVSAFGQTGIVIGVILGILGAAAIVIIGVWVGIRLSLVPSVLLIERAKFGAALRRSWSLTTGYFWRTLGIQLLVAVIISTAAQIVLTPVAIIMALVITLGDPNADTTLSNPGSFLLTYAVSSIVGAIVGSITAIISSSSTSLIYIDLRMRKEGLDLELARFVEARQAGATIGDPYEFVDHSASSQDGTPTPPTNESPWA